MSMDASDSRLGNIRRQSSSHNQSRPHNNNETDPNISTANASSDHFQPDNQIYSVDTALASSMFESRDQEGRPTGNQIDDGNNDSSNSLALAQMELILQLMDDDEMQPYNEACAHNPHLRSNQELRLHFLRIENYQPGLAAHRFTQYFNMLKETFGSNFRGNNLTLDDLSEEDQRALISGAIQVLPNKDPHGRSIIFVHQPTLSRGFSCENMFRAIVYSLNTMSSIDEADSEDHNDATAQSQHKIIWIQHAMGPERNLDLSLFFKQQRFNRFAAPVLIEVIHLIHDNLAALDAIAFMYESVLSQSMKTKLIVHLASTPDFSSRLQSFGIPLASFPIARDGSLLVQIHLEWILSRSRTEVSAGERKPKAAAATRLSQSFR